MRPYSGTHARRSRRCDLWVTFIEMFRELDPAIRRVAPLVLLGRPRALPMGQRLFRDFLAHTHGVSAIRPGSVTSSGEVFGVSAWGTSRQVLLHGIRCMPRP